MHSPIKPWELMKLEGLNDIQRLEKLIREKMKFQNVWKSLKRWNKVNPQGWCLYGDFINLDCGECHIPIKDKSNDKVIAILSAKNKAKDGNIIWLQSSLKMKSMGLRGTPRKYHKRIRNKCGCGNVVKVMGLCINCYTRKRYQEGK